MDDSELKGNQVVCENSEGLQITGSIIQLGRHEVTFEIYSPTAVIQTSELLKEFKIQLREQTAYSGRAVVKNVVHTETKIVCSAAFDDELQLKHAPEDLQRGKIQALFKEHLREWQKVSAIRSDYKLHLSEMENFFTELRLWLAQVELTIRSGAEKEWERKENELALDLADSVLPCIDALFNKFEHLAQELSEPARSAHRAYMHRRLHPLVLCAPFAHRTFTKPLGYAGDYEMVNMILRDAPEGESLYAKIIHLWFVRQPPAEAHRNRIKLLTRRIVEETVRAATPGQPARIFSLACGPAFELQDFVRDHEVCNRAELTLLDFNDQTIQYVNAAFSELKSKQSRRTPVHFVQRSVHQLLKDSARTGARPPLQQYDFVYCAGLFDYLTNAVCQRLMTLLYDWVAPGGLLLATNVEPSNPLRYGMEYLLDWNLIYRTSHDMRAIRPSQVAPQDFVVQADLTGLNLFLEARKPLHG